ncbi:MAG: hypothetical protein KA714_20185 [Limnoraphis sp. WC205]|nr:hypothetical protein [Limnoraphis sp. WC205]
MSQLLKEVAILIACRYAIGTQTTYWILNQLSHPQPETEPLSEKIGDLIGAIDSQDA